MNAGHFTPITFYRLLLVELLLLIYFVSPAASLVTIPLSSPSFVYSPYVCNATEVSLDANACQGGWQMSEDSNTVQFSTTGSSNAVLPQIFFRFRARDVYITTTPDSNATVDVTVASGSIKRTSTFDSSTGLIAIMDLPFNSFLSLSISASTSPTLLGLTSLQITTPSDTPISSTLPPPTTPSSAISPKFPFHTSTGSTPDTSRTNSIERGRARSHQATILGLGLAIGLGVGVPLIAILIYGVFRCRKKPDSEPKHQRWSFMTP